MSYFTKDLVERAIRTFVQAALAVVALDLANVTNVDGAKAVGLAAVTAGISAVMSLLTKRIGGDTETASVLPPE